MLHCNFAHMPQDEEAKAIAAEERKKEEMILKERIQEESSKLISLDKDVDDVQVEMLTLSLRQLWSDYRPGTSPPASLFGKVDPESNTDGIRENDGVNLMQRDSRSPTRTHSRSPSRRSSRSPSRRSSRSPSRRSSRSLTNRNSRKKFGNVLSQAARNYFEGLEKGLVGIEDDSDEDKSKAASDINEEDEDIIDELSTYTRYKPPPVVERRPRDRPLSFVDKKIQTVQQNRLQLIQQKEALTKKRLDDRIEKRKQNAEKQRIVALKTSWMIIIAHFSRLNVLKNILEEHRTELKKWANASRDKKAVRDIELWWPKQFIHYKLHKKFPFSRFALATLFMNRWRKMRIKQRNQAQALIVQFIGDVTGLGETMRKVYVFRVKVKRVQEWVRMYFQLYFARLQVLWKVLQQEEEKLRKIVSRGAQIKLRRARNSVNKIKGFGQKANLIEQVSGNISSLLKFQEEMGSRRKHKSMVDGDRSQKIVGNKVVSKMRQWQAEAMATEDGAEKMEFIVQLLQKLRHANVVKNDAAKHRTIGKGPRSDASDAKIFLSDNKVSMPKLAASLAEMEDPNVKSSKRYPFYMLTGNGGALDEIREWIHKYYHRKYYEEFMVVEEETRNPTPVEGVKKMHLF